MARSRTFRGWIPACGVIVSLLISWRGEGSDWPQYRGANHNGVSTDRISRQWTGAVTNPVWRIVLTNALGSVAVSGGRVFTQTRRNILGASREVCVALSLTDGAELWSANIDEASYPNGGVGFDDGPRTTPAVNGDSAYVLSSYLKLYRLNVTNGAVIWDRDLRAIYGGAVIAWQNAASPVIDNGLIFLNANCGNSTLMALRASDGEPEWRSENEAMTHSTPVLATIHGVRQVIFATQSGLVSLEAQSGAFLWRFNYPFTYNTSIGASPVVWEDMVFVSGAQVYNMGSAVARVSFTNSAWSATQLWAKTTFASTLSTHWMTPVCHEGFLYGQFGVQQFDSVNAQLKCVEMRTGDVKWSTNGFGRGGTILVDNHLLTLTERGDLVLSEPKTNAYTQLGRFTAILHHHGNTNKGWNVPAVADGRVYVRSTAYVAAFDFSVPELKLDLPKIVANEIHLTVRAADGSALDSNRVAALEIRASTDITQPLTQWSRLTNGPVLTNGLLRFGGIQAGTETQRWFIVTEP